MQLLKGGAIAPPIFMKGSDFMFFGSGDGGEDWRAVIFFFVALCFLMVFNISSVYAEETTNPYVPYEVTNFNFNVDSDSELVTISFNYKGKTYSVTDNVLYKHYLGNKDFVVITAYTEGANSQTLNVRLTNSLCDYSSLDDTLNIQSLYTIPINLETFEYKILNSGSLGTSHKKNISYSNSSLNSEYFVYANFDIPNTAGGYFFQLPPPPPPTILEGVSLEGVLTQVVYLLPSCLLLTISYLALRKALSLLFKLLKMA